MATSPVYPKVDYYTAKYGAADGTLLWEHFYNDCDGGEDHPEAMTLDGTGNVAVTGVSASAMEGFRYYTEKYAAADGHRLWRQSYVSPGGYGSGTGVVVDSAGNVVVTGFFYNAAGNKD